MNKTGFGGYSSPEDYQNHLRKSGRQRKANDYEVFNWCLCLECKHFKVDKHFHTQGDCLLMWKEGAYGGVMAQAVCNRFMSTEGMDINGKVVEPSLLPAWVKTRKTKTGETYAAG
jgi:hypothetical protein